jgi:DNA repair exonuclease SbcCD ATPase subunit
LEGGGPQKKTDVPEALDAYFTELAQARREIASLRQQHAEDCQRYEADEGELRQRLEALKSELLRVQKVNEQAYVLRSVYDPMFERLTDLEREVAELRTHRMEAIPLLQERDAIVNSTTWKLTSAPRAFLTLLRRGKHG